MSKTNGSKKVTKAAKRFKGLASLSLAQLRKIAEAHKSGLSYGAIEADGKRFGLRQSRGFYAMRAVRRYALIKSGKLTPRPAK